MFCMGSTEGLLVKLMEGSFSGVSGGGAAGEKFILGSIPPPDIRLSDRALASAAFCSLVVRI